MIILKETSLSSCESDDLLQQTFSKLSSDEKNVLGKEALQLANMNCKSIIDTMQNEGELQIYWDGSVKDG